MTPREALERLLRGNQRFVDSTERQIVGKSSRERRVELSAGQAPFAVIVTCADSRLPAEIIFDEGLGDLFVIRVAGNVISPEVVGSVEYAAAELGSALVVVMGHTQCGAVGAALASVSDPSIEFSTGLSSLVDRIRPSVEHTLQHTDSANGDDIVDAAVVDNTKASVRLLIESSDTLKSLAETESINIIGMLYSIDTGEVRVLQNLLHH